MVDTGVETKTIRKRTPWQIQRAVVFALVMRELKTRFGGQWTGVIWLFGVPLAQLFVFVWINTVIRGRISRAGYDFVVWLIIAMIPYDVFRTLWNQLMKAPSSNKGLFNFRQVKPMDTFIARAVLEIALQSTIFLLIALALARFGYAPLVPHDLLAFLGVVSMFCALGIGLGICSAVLDEMIPRYAVFVGLVTMPLSIVSGVIFPLTSLPNSILYWLLFNPVLHLVELARHAYLPGYVMVQGVNATYPAVWIVVVMALAMSMYRVRRRELISQN
jgi:capsular polysaccharide transport system permease protein